MPVPDPVPPRPNPAKQRFVRLMKLGALFSMVIAAIAVLLVARGDSGLHIHMLIATALGVGLSVMMAIALMSLIFLSNREGHDQAAHRHQDQDDQRP